MRAILHNHDMIARVCGPDEGVEVGDKPAGVGLERLRFDGSQLVDIATLSEFYVVRRDGSWELHAIEVPGSQLVQMSHKQKWRLVNDGGTYRLKTDDELLEEAKRAKCFEVDKRRVVQSHPLPFTIPSSGTSIKVNFEELAPDKPRTSWLQGQSAKALACKVEGESFTEELKAADDQWYSMTRQDWIDLGKALGQWVSDHLKAADSHFADIDGYTTIEEVEGHDLSLYWP